MKRYILSGIVIISFIAFSVYYRYFGQSTNLNSNVNPNQVVIPPLSVNLKDDSESTSEPTSGGILTPIPISISNSTSKPTYKDGTFVGDPSDAIYGSIQIQTIIKNGKIVDVQFLQSPSDRSRSVEINTYAMPILKTEAIQVQNANVDIVSGATDSSQAFIQSLQTALNKAKI